MIGGDGGETVRVSSKGHNVFMPKWSAGRMAIAEGEFTLKTLSKEQAQQRIGGMGALFRLCHMGSTTLTMSFSGEPPSVVAKTMSKIMMPFFKAQWRMHRCAASTCREAATQQRGRRQRRKPRAAIKAGAA